MNKLISQLIENLGFDNKESAVYASCLELGEATNTQISKISRLNRITNYEILKRLERRGAVSSYKKRKAKYFVVVDPRVLVKEAKEKVNLVEAGLPELVALANSSPKQPKIHYYEGLQGIKNIYEDSLNSKTEILTLTNPKDLYSYFGKYADKYVSDRVKKRINVKALGPNDSYGQKAKREDTSLRRQTKLFETNDYRIFNEVMIYDNKVALHASKDEIGIVIENQSIADTLRSLWQMAWDKTDTTLPKAKIPDIIKQ